LERKERGGERERRERRLGGSLLWRGGRTGRRGGKMPPAAAPDPSWVTRNGKKVLGLGRRPTGFDPAEIKDGHPIQINGQQRSLLIGPLPAKASAEVGCAPAAGTCSEQTGRAVLATRAYERPCSVLGLLGTMHSKEREQLHYFQKHFK